jgi:protein yorkie
MDPFLSGINEQHARQESADSGLGLGSAYSLPHTPEDFLANIDDNMDGTSGQYLYSVTYHVSGDLNLSAY